MPLLAEAVKKGGMSWLWPFDWGHFSSVPSLNTAQMQSISGFAAWQDPFGREIHPTLFNGFHHWPS